MTSMSSLTTQHGPFAPPITQSSKPPQAQEYLDGTCFFDVPFIANWNKIGDYRQRQTDICTERENKGRVDYDYKIGNRVLVIQDGILCKAQSPHSKEPWTITTVHTNGTIRIQCRTKTEQINIRKVTPYTDE